MTVRKPIAGTNLEQAKSHNRRVVIEAIRTHGALSRAAIARLTALSSQTVSNIVEELEAIKLLRPEPTRKGTRGQPAVPYSINPDGGYSIGLQLDHQTLVGVVTDLSGTVRARIERRVDRPRPEDAMPILAAMPVDLMHEFRFDRRQLLGIGMAMPGPFDVEGMTSVGPTALPGWEHFALATELEKLTGIPVTVENDATAAAIGERLYGVARNLNSFVYLFIGTGLGAGLFLDGHLYKGNRHNAGEIGHMIVRPDGLRVAFDTTLRPFERGNGVLAVAGVCREVTELASEAALDRLRSARYRAVFESGPHPMAIATTEGLFLSTNRAFKQLFSGASHIDDLVAAIHRNQRAALGTAWFESTRETGSSQGAIAETVSGRRASSTVPSARNLGS